MDTIKIEKKNTLMVAHRGVSGLEKENTLAAFIAAGRLVLRKGLTRLEVAGG